LNTYREELMEKMDPRVDLYIARSADFAKPILNRLRKLVHRTCPAVSETMKWGFPHFEYKGILCSMASFKQHCALGFWKAALMKDPHKVMTTVGKTAMGHFGRITQSSDLPGDRILVQYIRQAVKLNEGQIKLPPRTRLSGKKELKIPDYLMQALRKNKKALETFNHFSYSNKRDYLEWVTEAKTEATRARRLAMTVEWMKEGKIRNWKYLMPSPHLRTASGI